MIYNYILIEIKRSKLRDPIELAFYWGVWGKDGGETGQNYCKGYKSLIY